MYSLRRRGHIVRLVDTPGFDDTKKSDVEVLTDIAYWLGRAYAAEPKILLSGIIYLHPINGPKMQGSAKKNLLMFKALCGNATLDSVVLATTMWSKLSSPEDGEERQRMLIETEDFWGSMVKQGSKTFQHYNSAASAFKVIDYIIERRKPVILDIQRQIIDGKLEIHDTSAGQEQMKVVLREKKKAQDRLQRNEEELNEVLESREQESKNDLLQAQERYRRQIEEKDKSIHALKVNMETLQKEKEAQWKRELEIQRENEAAHEAKMAELREELMQVRKNEEAAISKAEEMDLAQIALEKKTSEMVQRRNQDALEELARAQEPAQPHVNLALQVSAFESRTAVLEQQMAVLVQQRKMMEQHKMKRITMWGTVFGGAGAVMAGLAACCVM